jgi:Methyl-accepting chemotaxis protein (MCP) signalling domain
MRAVIRVIMPAIVLTPSAATTKTRATPERILELSKAAANCIEMTGGEIAQINLQTRLLAFNAQIEAARAGSVGQCFGVVASEMVGLSDRTQKAAAGLQNESLSLIRELSGICENLATEVRGSRLSDMALGNIDLIDRNLYERSCDCRWWATDGAMVAALTEGGEKTIAFASERMGVILKAYTVYFDIVLADRHGRIIANGNPADYASVGKVVADTTWFRTAWNSRNGDQFGFETVHVSQLAGGKRVLVYSCKVCSEGHADGSPLGVLGVVFRWDALADTIVRATPVDDVSPEKTRVCIVSPEGLILADSRGRALEETLNVTEFGALFKGKKGFGVVNIGGRSHLVGHGFSPGFETYSTGWHSLVIREV